MEKRRCDKCKEIVPTIRRDKLSNMWKCDRCAGLK
jgi:ribosomal protein L37AE/L43A